MIATPLPACILALALAVAAPASLHAAETPDDAPMATAQPVIQPGAVQAGAVNASPAVTAAPTPAAPVSTADQIAAYLKASPAVMPNDGALGVTTSEAPRKVHGEVSVSVGTGGYRDFYARSDLPVGKTGTLSIAVEQGRSSRGGYGYGYGRFGGYGGGLGGYNYGRGGGDIQRLGIGLALGGSSAESERCRLSSDGSPDRNLTDPSRPCRGPGDLLPLD